MLICTVSLPFIVGLAAFVALTHVIKFKWLNIATEVTAKRPFDDPPCCVRSRTLCRYVWGFPGVLDASSLVTFTHVLTGTGNHEPA
jgi:hypothetical protein